MKKQKILILHFPNLNNYGTGMMGLITIQSLADRFGLKNVEFYCDFDESADIDEIRSELRGEILLKRFINETPKKIEKIRNLMIKKMRIFFYLLLNFEGKGFDKIIVLGGDDLSEYYSPYGAAFEIFSYWKSSFRTKVILLGQTIGPFSHKFNRFASKYLLPRVNVFARDPLCVQYMQKEFGIKIGLMADIALDDLPLQKESSIEVEILKKYDLIKDEYFTIVISGLQKKNYYCEDHQIYLKRFKELIEKLSDISQLNHKKICLLAHTFPPYAEVISDIHKLKKLIPEKLKERIVLVLDRVLETRARFILGNGLFTISGPLHPSISTFQMGKPAICLSYSAKYKGVIGESIGRYDLLLESNDPEMWNDGRILLSIERKVEYMLANYVVLCAQIQERIKSQKQLVKNIFAEL